MRTTSFFPLTAFLAAVSLLLSGCSSLPGAGAAGTVPETEETQEKQEGITNPYVSDVFILHVPDAPQASGEGLINGSYEWELPRYTGEILQTE